jgi:putative membrane protein
MGGVSNESEPANSKGAGARALTGGSALSQVAPEDATFLRDAMQSGQAETRLGQLAIQDSQNPAVQSFGQRLVEDHMKMDEELAQLASEKGVETPTQTTLSQSAMISHLSSLRGAEFDQAWQRDTVDTHTHAVQTYRLAASRSQDPDIKAFAQKYLPALEEHLTMARHLPSGGASEPMGGTSE